MDAFSWNKGFREFFAVKATPSPVILKLLCELGCGLDCSSLTELMLAEAIGVTDSDIMFSSNATPAEEYVYARKLGATINLDDITHIGFLEKHAGLPETISCRYNPGRFEISNSIMDDPSNAKYGFTHEQIIEGFKALKARGVKKFGLHAFLSSNTMTEEYYPALSRLLFLLAVELAEETGVEITFINLSGGIDSVLSAEGKRYIRNRGRRAQGVEEVLVPRGLGGVSIYTELGRYMTDLTVRLLRRQSTKRYLQNYIGLTPVRATLCVRRCMAYHHITVPRENEPCNRVRHNGSLCENNDKFAKDRAAEIEIGDYIYIHDTGAHGHSMGYTHNGKPVPQSFAARGRSVELIRERRPRRIISQHLIF